MYDEFGGRQACLKLSERFYARVANDPVLRPLFSKSFTCAIEAFAAFLAQFLGGPADDSQRRWWLSLQESHQRFKIGPKERAAWLKLMTETLDEIDLPGADKTAFKALFERSSAYLVNQSSTKPIPHAELACRWDQQLKLDQAVASIRRRDLPRALQLTDELKQNPTIFVGLLTLLIKSGSSEALQYVEGVINPTLAQVRHSYNRTLLHEAAAAGRPQLVERLLQFEVNPDAGVLYCLANECRKPREGAAIVNILASAGANVNSQDNKQRTTPLHMAARRGFKEIAQALLTCGAQVNLRDRNGDTPLRRAMNCNKPEVAKLLRQHNGSL